ncbi:MAG: hypothetical protein D6797_04785 [Bdellovibrio sp.]|nr:MAG: hypothetical protein D6797_04785 [Bdellovibrio sp.]
MILRNLFLIVLFCFAFQLKAQTLAVVGKSTISLQEFKKKYEKIKSQTINPPSPSTFLEDLIRFEIGVQEAEKEGLRNDPLVKEKIKEVLYKYFVEKHIGKKVEKIKVTEKEMREYYKNNPEIRTSHILIEFSPNATQKQIEIARKRALEIYNEVKKSKEPFEKLVKLYSDDTISKRYGGDIGYQSRTTLIPTYYEAAKKMKIGEIKGLIRSRYGFHIIKLTGRRTYSQANKQQIRAAVFDLKRKKIFDQFFRKLKRKYKIKVKKSLLRKIK